MSGPHETFAAALKRFRSASDALTEASKRNALSDAVIREAVDAAADARLAFEGIVKAAFERAARARAGR